MAPRCSICKKPVAKTHRSIECDGCNQWCHIKCGKVSPNEYEQYTHLQDFDWLCPNCNHSEYVDNDNVDCNDSETVDNDNIVSDEKIQAFKEIADGIKKGSGIQIAHLNVNGILEKLHIVKVLLEETNLDILAVSETHLRSDVPDEEVEIENYEMLRRDRKTDNGWGGVIIYHKEFLNGIEYENETENDLEMVWLECNVKSQRFLISCVYQPPRDHGTFFTKFEPIISSMTSKGRHNVIILGDLNIDMLEENQSSASIRNRFNKILKAYNLQNVIHEPTRITKTSTTLIDHIIIPNSISHKLNNAHSVDPAISDHHLIYCSFSLARPKEKPTYRTVRNYKNVNIEKLKNDINMVPWQICDIFDDVDDTLFAWQNLYEDVINNHFKKRKVKIRTKSHPWINGQIRKKLNNRFKLLKAARKTAKDSHEWKMYKQARNHCTKILRIAEARYWRNKFQGLSPSSKNFWDCINDYIGKKKRNNIAPLEDEKGIITTNETEKCKILNSYFANVGKVDKIPKNAELNSHIYRVTPTISGIEYGFPKLTQSFNRVFKPNKASGHDEVSSKVVRMIGEDILLGLHYVAKTSFQTSTFPTNHKIAKVTCIFKNKGSKAKSENYRPISLLCLPGKLLEAVVTSEINKHINQHQLLSNHQWGFRKGRSPELMLLAMCERWSGLLEKGKMVGVLLIDFSKAFDSVCHQTLLKKIKAIGISGDIYK